MRALTVGSDEAVWICQLDEMNLDSPIHRKDKFVVRAAEPGRQAVGACYFDHIFEILADRNALVRRRLGRDLEQIGKYIVARIIVDDLYTALVVVLQGSKLGNRHDVPRVILYSARARTMKAEGSVT